MTPKTGAPLPANYERRRYLRPAAPGYDVYEGTYLAHTWLETADRTRRPGHWSDTRRGHVEQEMNGTWRAWYMVGDNPQRYEIEGRWATAADAGKAVMEYAAEQGRIGQAQVDYQRANGWSID